MPSGSLLKKLVLVSISTGVEANVASDSESSTEERFDDISSTALIAISNKIALLAGLCRVDTYTELHSIQSSNECCLLAIKAGNLLVLACSSDSNHW
jgi:hypothetical protein